MQRVKVDKGHMQVLAKWKLISGAASRTLLSFGIVLVGVQALAFAQTPSVAARRVSGSITLDGKLDEPEWREAQVIRLTQQAPHPGADTPYTTEVRVLVASDAIY